MSAEIEIVIHGGECRIKELSAFMCAANSICARTVDAVALADGAVRLVCKAAPALLGLADGIAVTERRTAGGES